MTTTTTNSEKGLLAWRDRWVAKINEGLSRAITQGPGTVPGPVARLTQAMNYTIESGGKRLRALLALAAAGAVGGRESWALPGALAVEMIHAYSLIHDDLPALDDDDLRRGKPSCHLAFGEAAAILAGDALQSMAFQTLASAPLKVGRASERIRGAMVILSQATGLLGMVGGQQMDLEFEGGSPALSEILDMEERKTGYLIGACLAIGATLGGATPETVAKFQDVGRLVGLAFQITDDLLNVTGNPELMGKNVGTDAKKSKASVAAALSHDKANEMANALIGEALPKIESFGSDKLEWLIRSVIGRSS
jgi:geranylgeranyl pyrophosphate synthase